MFAVRFLSRSRNVGVVSGATSCTRVSLFSQHVFSRACFGTCKTVPARTSGDLCLVGHRRFCSKSASSLAFSPSSIPAAPFYLGVAGLIPQIACVGAVLFTEDLTMHSAALTIAHAYSASILTFLGGMWWGIAASAPIPQRHQPDSSALLASPAPHWLWFAAVSPSLIAVATYLPSAFGISPAVWMSPSLMFLGCSLFASPIIDRKLASRALVPAWWWSLRIMLSLGLGTLTILLASIDKKVVGEKIMQKQVRS